MVAGIGELRLGLFEGGFHLGGIVRFPTAGQGLVELVEVGGDSRHLRATSALLLRCRFRWHGGDLILCNQNGGTEYERDDEDKHFLHAVNALSVLRPNKPVRPLVL